MNEQRSYGETARRAFVVTLVSVAVIVGAFALWKLRLLLALLFVAITIAAAMRPGVEALARHRSGSFASDPLPRVPRPSGAVLAVAVPGLIDQVQAAMDSVQTHKEGTGAGSRRRS